MNEKETTQSEAKVSSLEQELRRSVHDHPFSIESILNGRTRRKKCKNSGQIEKKDERGQEALPLSALEKFTSKTFSTMKAKHKTEKDEEPVIVRERLKFLAAAKATTKKTRRKARTCFTNQQIYELERRFLYQKYLSPQDRDELSEMLNLSNAQVITWFQNRRAKLKRDIEEMRNDLAATRTLHATQAACSEFRCRFNDCR